MPIKVDLHDNTSQVKVRTKCNSEVNIDTGCSTEKNRFEQMIKQEIEDRIAGDAYLQEEINKLKVGFVDALLIDEQENGCISISLVNDKGEAIDTKTITLTEKIIKSAEFDEENKKLIYTCNDDSVIELDISSIVDNVEELISKVAALETEVEKINSELSILDTRVENTELQLSTVINETIPSINQEISDIHNELGIVNQNISDINLTLSDITDEVIPGINTRLDTLDQAVADAIIELSILQETKVDINFNLDEEDPAKRYTRYIPKDLTPEQTREMLIYINNNGIPSYAKLNELGYVRVRDYNNPEDLTKVDSGDLLIDMD